jgi:asparagine synthase (glutamine-hydrolysing)
VEYHSDLWRSWYAASERLGFFRYAQVHASMPSIQDLPALAALVQRQVLPKDAVVVPGHSYDFLAGTHFPPEFIDCTAPSVDDLKNAIYKYHYGVWRTDPGHKRRMFDARTAWLDEREVTTQEQLSCLGDEWDWQERQAKFIVNAVRAYEYLGFEWRLPLWDNDVIAFWRRIPFAHRLGRSLYFAYTARHQEAVEAAIGVRRKPAQQRDEGPVSRIVSKLARQPLARELGFLAMFARAYRRHVLQLNIAPSFASHMTWYARGARDPKAVIGDGLTAEIKRGVYLESAAPAAGQGS